MESFSFPFERMSNLDMHPLSFPINRLSAAKSSSSIDQYAHHHHHHGKGDSAYSSFSGGSTAPDLSSPFFPDELHAPSLQYADFKYINEDSSVGEEPESKSMEQLYRSMEVLTRQQSEEEGKDCGNSHQQSSTKQASSPSPTLPTLPPPPPAPPTRLDSLVTIRAMESFHTRKGSEGGQLPANKSHTKSSALSMPPPYPGKQQQEGEPVNQDATTAQLKSAGAFSRLAQMHLGSAGLQGPADLDEEGPRRRAHSAYAALPYAPDHSHAPPQPLGSVNSSIQHKGHFYFVTGVCKTEPTRAAKITNNTLGNSSDGEPSLSVRKEGIFNMETSLRSTNHRRNSFDALSEGDHFPRAQELRVRRQVDDDLLDNCLLSKEPAQHVSNTLEVGQQCAAREITSRQHSAAHPIFYCGPVENVPHMQPTNQQMNNPTLTSELNTHSKENEEHLKKGRKSQPQLLDVPREKINKETTPLLYHLTAANRMSPMSKFKSESDSVKGGGNSERNQGAPAQPEKEWSHSKEDIFVSGEQKENCKIRPPAMETNLDDFSYPSNTLDDSFKKYYKEKLKDVQSRVLRETSFKRRDLQPHKIKQRREQPHPATLQVFPSSLDPLCIAEKLSQPWPQQPSHSSSDPKTRKETNIKTKKIQETVLDGGENDRTAQTEKEKTSSQESEAGASGEEKKKPTKVAQPQVARIGGRKRLTQEQKKICYSEPEQLHKLDEAPAHKPSHSLGNEDECQLTSNADPTGQSLVAARRKLFETRGRALSASSLSKTTLKHLQHKALVAYMERKTGHRAPDPQQPCPQVPSQRHSTAGRASDCGPRPHSSNGGPKKKLHRPLSAGRILDSPSSSLRYTQFNATSSWDPAQQSDWTQASPLSTAKAVSVESLLDLPDQPGMCRARSKSTPHAFQDHFSGSDASSSDSTSTLKGDVKLGMNMTQAYAVLDMDVPAVSSTTPVEGRRRVVAPRGKSMEELGVSKVIRPTCLSRSTEQLDQLQGKGWSCQPVSALPHAYHQSKERRRGGEGPLGGLQPGVWTHREAGGQALTRVVKADGQHTRNDSSSSFGSYHIEATTSSDPKPKLSPQDCRLSSSVTQAETVVTPQVQVGLYGEQREHKHLGSAQEVSLSHGVTTDPSLWPATPADKEDWEIEDQSSDALGKASMTTDMDSVPLSQSDQQLTPSPVTTRSCAEVEADTREGLGAGKKEEGGGTWQQIEGEANSEKQDVEGTGVEGSTEELAENDFPPPPPPVTTPPHHLWGALVEQVASSDQTLARVLRPIANRKTALMLMEQLLSEDTLLMEEHYRKRQEAQQQKEAQAEEETQERMGENGGDTLERLSKSFRQQPDVSTAGSKDMPESATMTKEDIMKKKRQLLACIEERLESLGEQRTSLRHDEEENGARGVTIAALVAERCHPTEQERYGLFVGDLERVVSLLLCLSARLARVQNALSAVDDDTDQEEKESLDNRYHLLCKQRDDAKDLKDNLDRRERLVSAFLSKQLSTGELQEYRRFVQTKASLLIRQKDLDERQRLGEEQRDALQNSLL